MEQLGTYMRRMRKQAGLTLDAVGARIGLPATFLSRIERGYVPMPSARLLDWADVVGADHVEALAKEAIEKGRIILQDGEHREDLVRAIITMTAA